MTDRITVDAPDAQAGNPTIPSQPAPETRPSANPEPATFSSTKKKSIKGLPAFSSSSTGIDPLLNVVSEAGLRTIRRMEPNFFFANATAFFQAVSHTDQRMVTTKKFLDGTDSWMPFMSHYHASLLWHLQIFRTYEKSNIPDPEAMNFLQWFERHIDLKNVPVPGSWAPYLRALTVVEPHHESFGNIAPLLPTITGSDINVTTAYTHPEQAMRLVPNPRLPLDQLRAYSAFTPNNANPIFHAYRNLFGLPISQDTGIAFRNILTTPSAFSWVGMSTSRHTICREFWTSNASMLPARLPHTPVQDNNFDIVDYFEYFGLKNLDGSWNYGFLSLFLNDMALYCQFVKGSIPLSTIDVVGLGAGIPRNVLTTSTVSRAYLYPTDIELRTRRHSAGHRVYPFLVEYNMTHGDLTLDLVGEQYGITTLVNLDLSNPAVRANAPNATRQWQRITRHAQVDGPFWDITPMREVRGFNPILGLSTVIPSYYHVTTPVTPKTN